MKKLRNTQDDHGFWMLSLEQENDTMTLLAHQFASPDHLVENANEMIAEGHLDAVIIVDPPRKSAGVAPPRDADVYQKPAPRKAGE